MSNPSAETVLYVVNSRGAGRNGRKIPLQELAIHFARVVQVNPGPHRRDGAFIQTPPWPNPSGILGLLGLTSLQHQLDRWLLYPGRGILFVLAVRRHLLRAIAADNKAGSRVTVLIVTPDHATSTLVPYLRKKLTGVRLVVDWQDLWTFDDTYLWRSPAALHDRLRRLETHIMRSADLNITTNHAAAEVLVTRHNLPVQQVASITHHYLAGDRTTLSTPVTGNREAITIGFLGTLFKHPKVPGEQVLAVLDQIADQGTKVELHVYGDQSGAGPAHVQDMRNALVTLHPRTEHQVAMQAISSCDLLLLVLADLPNCRVIMHGKLPHYLLLNKPIIAVVPEGSFVAELIHKTGTGVVIDAAQPWADKLSEVLAGFRADRLHIQRNEKEIAQYDWAHTQHQWVKVLAPQPHATALRSGSELPDQLYAGD